MSKLKAKKAKKGFRSEFIKTLPCCRVCGAIVLSTADRSQPSERVEWRGIHWTPTKPQTMAIYPSLPAENLCFYHRNYVKELGGKDAA